VKQLTISSEEDTMIKMKYHIDGAPNGVLTDGKLIIEIDEIDISKYHDGEHPYTLFYLCFSSLLNLIQEGENWKEWNSLLYGIVGLTFKNLNNVEMEIACHNTIGNSDNFLEKGSFYKISKNEFRKECIRLIGEFIEDVKWRDMVIINQQYDTTSLREFVKKFDSLIM